jgi:hypothetical protein
MTHAHEYINIFRFVLYCIYETKVWRDMKDNWAVPDMEYQI